MIASQTVYLNADRTRAVPEGDKEARFKLVHAGQEISQEEAEKYAGAAELIGGTRKAIHHSEPHKIETRDPAPHHRDPKHKHGL